MRMLLTSWIAGSCLTLFACSETGNAGVLMDAIINSRNVVNPGQTYQAATPVMAGYAPVSNYANVVSNYGTYASNYAPAVTPATSGYGPIPVGVPQTVPSYLPTAQYDTVWNRTPVTYYRPVTSFDPRLGTTVTSLQPCTGYQYQASRVPLIAPRAVLGEYGLQSNQWPAITGPGYNPTGLAVTSNYPGYQTLPNAGTVAPYANTVVPATTYPTAPAPYSVTSGYPTNVSPVTSYPAYSTPSTYRPSTQSFTQVDGSIWTPLPNGQNTAPMTPAATPVNPVLPATSYYPAIPSTPNVNCPNGMCPLPAAASIQPIGQPTYSPVPSVDTLTGTSSVGSSAVLPYSNSNSVSPGAQPTMGGVADPESVRQPTYDGRTTAQKATTDHLINSSEQSNRSDRPAISAPPLHGGVLPWNREPQTKTEEPKPAPVDRSGKLEIPSTLPSSEATRGSYKANPLRAPEGMETKALWNPDFVGTSNVEGRSVDANPIQELKPASKQSDAPIQFISGSLNSRKDKTYPNLGIYFREIVPSIR